MLKENKFIALALIAIIIIAIAGLYRPVNVTVQMPASEDSYGASGTRFPNGISADTTSPVAGEVRGTTLNITSTSALAGLLTLNAGQLRSYTNSTSTKAATQTLALADFNGYDTILLTPNSTAVALTFPASSTIPTFLPTAGDMQETCIYNATSSASIDAYIRLLAGTGIDLEVVATSTTAGNVNIPEGGYACLKFVRQKATASSFDISVLMTQYIDAD